MQHKTELKGNLMLILTAMIWGAAFVAQDVGMDYVEPFTFNAARMILGAFTLVPVIIFTDWYSNKNQISGKKSAIFSFTKTELIGGIYCGVALFAGSSLQQIGISLYTDADAAAGKAGFITALYIVLVPVAGIFLRKKANFITWISVVIATVGMYLLCVKTGAKLQTADILLFACALAFTVHILVIDHFSPLVNGMKLSAVQFLTAGILAGICMLFFEKPTISGISGATIPILYAGMLSCAVAYTLQVVAQKYTKPAIASVLMSLESVFAALTGLLFGERMSGQEALGCLLMFAAVLLAQVDPKWLFKQTEK